MKTEPLAASAGRPALPDAPDESAGLAREPRVETLGRFDVLETVGRGGYGEVVRAFDRNLQRIVAIKMMRAELAATLPARKRFVREARAAAAVRHDNVVRIYEVAEAPVPHLVMEYVPGGSLQRHLDERGPLAVREVLHLGAQIARGLAAAHATGLVHRDVKPGNVLLELGGATRARLTDFGIARAADDASLTESGVVVGTPSYMAPEQAKGERIDHRADLFSLGSVLYAMVGGHPPFRAPNSLAVLKRVADAAPRPIRDVSPDTPGWLCDIIARLHARDPGDRFQSAAEVAELLEAHLSAVDGGRPVRPLTAGRRERRWQRPAGLAGAVLAAAALGAALLGRAVAPPEQSSDPPAAPDVTAIEGPAVPPRVAYTNVLGMQFARIPAGGSRLGGGGGGAGTEPVAFDRDFYMGVYEVTQAEWEAVMGAGNNPSRYSRRGVHREVVADVPDQILGRYPVEAVSWEAAQAFVRRLNGRLTEPGWVYRLPRTTEWEYACRGGPDRPSEELGQDFYLDRAVRELGADQANFASADLRGPRPVGSYPPNRLGLHDMHGNAFELCDDVVRTPSGWVCGFRGGFWLDRAPQCRAGARPGGSVENAYDGAGLRLVRVPVAEYTRRPDPRLSPEQQAEAFRADLKRLNPDLASPIHAGITDGRVTAVHIPDARPLRDLAPFRLLPDLQSLTIVCGSFTDLSPLRGLPLRELDVTSNWVLSDLSPLRGMRLERLDLWGFQGEDLSPLEGMPLRRLNCGGARKKPDLTPLRGLPLKDLCLNCTAIDDLSPLRGKELDKLMINETRVRDLSPLAGMKIKELSFHGTPVADPTPIRTLPLEYVELDFQPARDAELLRSLPLLATINKKPATAFWEAQSKR
jgi:formylglycine-generating enzyme required for sulfatase activity/tRNA A-37 threonylcarbamoyl transferase component Bud32